MAKIAFILLCHKDPDAIIRQALSLTAAGDFIAIHFDGNAPKADFDRVYQALKDNPSVTFAAKRIKCGWAEWTLVEATLLAVEAAAQAFPRATHFYMVSGDCMPIKSAAYVHEYLDGADVDYIESFDFFKSDWIKTGIKEERLIYRFYFNERKTKWLFYKSLALQQRLGLRRAIPEDLQIQIGSQWWCLRRLTVEAILRFCKERRDVMRFFKRTWIPDETFFQTLVRHLVPDVEIRSRTLTFLMFTDYGMPVTFYNDHYDLLLSQDYLFARKISPGATELKERLGVLYADASADFRISNEGRSLFGFITQLGRSGRRFAPRVWEAKATLGRNRELLIVTCKKWHVAKRLRDEIERRGILPSVAYLFDEEATAMPDLGGIEKTLSKRTRHRRALVRLLFDYHQSDRLMILLDPADLDVIKDFYADRAAVRLLEIDCDFSDDYLIGHARRTGLLGERTSAETIRRLLPSLRDSVLRESEHIRDSSFPGYALLSEKQSPAQNAAALAKFLDLPEPEAAEILALDYLFSD